MSQQGTFTSDHQEALEAFVNTVQSDQGQVAAAAADYINANVSASATIGTSGANFQGWITYTESGHKIHFQLEGKPSSYSGLFAGGGVLALVGALRPEQLGGQVGTFEVSGVAAGGLLTMWVDGKAVTAIPIPLVGAGWPFGWGAKGKVRFSNPVS
jgi:hypothetical protein